MAFYTFTQNNSGGSNYGYWNVIIEADDADKANEIVRDYDVYFDGCYYGWDCPCCGDRWYPAHGEGYEVPSLYGEGTEIVNKDREFVYQMGKWDNLGEMFGADDFVKIVYKDGTIQTFKTMKG